MVETEMIEEMIDALVKQVGELQAENEVLKRQIQVMLPRISAAENSCRKLEMAATGLAHVTAGDILKAHVHTSIGKIASDRKDAIDKDNALRVEKSAAEARGLDLEAYRRDRAEREQNKAARIAAEQARIARMAPSDLKLPMAQINGTAQMPKPQFGEDLDD